MANSIVSAPGKDLETFITTIACDLKKRKIEYLIIGLFNNETVPIGMEEIRGRSSWVDFEISHIIELARKYKATSICLLHNHPCSPSETPNLSPSSADYKSLKHLLEEIDDASIGFLGSWITSNGKFTEILNYYNDIGQKTLGNDVCLTDEIVSKFLTLELKDKYKKIVKAELVHVSWFLLFTEYLGRSKYSFNILRFKYYGQAFVDYSFRIDLQDNVANNHIGSMTIEEAMRAADSLRELVKVAQSLEVEENEYSELKLTLSENIKCGAFQDETKKNAFITIDQNQDFVKVNDLKVLIKFIELGLSKIEDLMDKDNNTNN